MRINENTYQIEWPDLYSNSTKTTKKQLEDEKKERERDDWVKLLTRKKREYID